MGRKEDVLAKVAARADQKKKEKTLSESLREKAVSSDFWAAVEAAEDDKALDEVIGSEVSNIASIRSILKVLVPLVKHLKYLVEK